MSPERRNAERHTRRLEVRFWRPDKAQPYSGFTTNISTSGLFLGTTQALEPGERVRLEVLDRKAGFLVEGLVARVHRVSIALRHVDQPGAGIRFLDPEELVTNLIPALRGRSASARSRAARPADAVADVEAAEPAGEEARAPVERPHVVERPSAPAPPSTVEDPRAPVSRPEDLGAPPASGGPAPRERTAGPMVIPVDFSDRSSFLSVYHRDLSSGTLFVSTDVPAEVEDTVIIELNTPVPTPEPLRFEAKVVHRFEPEAAVGKGRNVLAGMGVRFTDLERLMAELAPVLAELRR